MQVNRKTASGFAILAATAIATLIPTLAQAQGYGFDPDPFRYGYQPTEPAGMGLVRLLLIVALGGLGFGVGWFLSPHAKAFRRVILLGLGVIALLFIMFNGSFVSWAMAWAFGYVAFFVGIGYWLSAVVSKLGKTPTTFGSAKWADAEHLKAHKVFDPKPSKPKAEPATSLIDRALGYFQEKAEVTPLKENPFASTGLTFPGLNQFQVDLPSFGSGNISDSLPTPVPKLKPGIRLGLAHDGERDEVFYYRGDRHLLTVAPTRSGKGTTQIVPNLLTYKGSALVIDPKGENARITAKERKALGHDVYIVDPWGIAVTDDQEPARLNPLDWLSLGDPDLTENSMLLADALIVQADHKEAFWTEEAKALLQGIILYVATDPHEEGQRHLARVRDLMLLDGDDLKTLFNRMVQSPHHVVASTGARSLQKEERLLANVLASAQAQTHFLDSNRIRENLSASDFDFADLKTKPMTIYLVLPSDRLNAFSRWMRLLVQQAITVNARNIEKKPKQPVLFLLDEMPTLGRLAMVEQAYGLMAGFGMQLWGIVQDLGQLKRIYGEGWETFIGNSGVIQYFGSHDSMTANYFSELCGVTTVWSLSSAISTAFGTSSGQGGASSSRTVTESDTRSAAQRKLIYPDELMRMHARKQLVFIENMDPIQAKRLPWFEDPVLKRKGENLHG